MTELKDVIAAAVEKGDYRLDVRDGVLRAVYFGSDAESIGWPIGEPLKVNSIADVVGRLRDVKDDLFGKASDAMPPVGPLTSTERLKAGDVLRSLNAVEECRECGSILRFLKSSGDYVLWYRDIKGDSTSSSDPSSFAFVARPGVWMPWEGGDNPAPGMNVKTRLADGTKTASAPSRNFRWNHLFAAPRLGDITAYMVLPDQ